MGVCQMERGRPILLTNTLKLMLQRRVSTAEAKVQVSLLFPVACHNKFVKLLDYDSFLGYILHNNNMRNNVGL